MDTHPRQRTETSAVHTKHVPENVIGAFGQNDLTMDEASFKDALKEVVAIEDREVI